MRAMRLAPGCVRLDDVLLVCQTDDGLNAGLLAELLSLFVSENAARINLALRAAAHGDTETYRTAVHAVRGSASLFGADLLQGIARDCEQRAIDGARDGFVADADQLRDEFNAVAATLRERYPDLLNR